jgi:hypothetical protein
MHHVPLLRPRKPKTSPLADGEVEAAHGGEVAVDLAEDNEDASAALKAAE